MLIFCDILAAILRMATSINFSVAGINSGHHNLPTYEMALESDNVEFVWYCGGHFENGDRKKFFNLGNEFRTSLSTHISNFDDIGQG
jgi:5-carboxymethyl-2-hydroxymuconate isomerase